MSKLIVEVCTVDKVEPHENADKLAVASIKGWKVCITCDPVTKVAQFQEGEKCIFFPPDAILPLALCNGPNDVPKGRLGNFKYLHHLPKDEFGVRPEGGRVVACRLRGQVSYGVIMKIDPTWGDDPNWEVGQDVADHFGVTKYDPPPPTNDGQAEKPSTFFHRYTELENFANYPKAIEDGTEVVFTEKLHGKNCRVGFILDELEEGQKDWVFTAGSHDVRRKEWSKVETRYRIDELIANGILAEPPVTGTIFNDNGRIWQVDYVFEQPIKIPVVENEVIVSYNETVINKCQCFEVRDKENGFEPVLVRSEFWLPLNDNVKALLTYIRDEHEPEEPKYSVIVFGELIGAGVQDMAYGFSGKSFRAFDIAVNNKYLSYDVKKELLEKFGVEMVPILYRGPFNKETLELHTSGPTTMCETKAAGKFAGREGIVCTPTVEVPYCRVLNGRRIVKSVSADYLARKGGTEFH
jgi:hypothetical protein